MIKFAIAKMWQYQSRHDRVWPSYSGNDTTLFDRWELCNWAECGNRSRLQGRQGCEDPEECHSERNTREEPLMDSLLNHWLEVLRRKMGLYITDYLLHSSPSLRFWERVLFSGISKHISCRTRFCMCVDSKSASRLELKLLENSWNYTYLHH